MAFLSETEKVALAGSIRRIEEKTSGELVTVLAGASDRYIFVALFCAAAVAIAVHGVLMMFAFAVNVFFLEVLIFLVLALLFQWSPIRYRLAPKRLKQLRAHRVAREQFLEQGIHLTGGHSGILLFVSVAEHYVELIADKGINDAVPEGAWDDIVGALIVSVRQGKIAEGFEVAISEIGLLLATHAPSSGTDQNELPNHLVEI